MPSLKYLGHSAFILEDDRHSIVIDPFITGNPSAPLKVSDLQRCDYVLLTHGHGDHFGDTLSIARRFNATVIATWELAQFIGARGIQVHPLSAGGACSFPFGQVKATLAFHGCGADPLPDGSVPPPNTPVGYLIHWQHGDKTIYHAGDTALFSDMQAIGRLPKGRRIDLACLPIGDNFTMGLEDAQQAAALLEARRYVPMHYNTFPYIEVDVDRFASLLNADGRECRILAPGDVQEV